MNSTVTRQRASGAGRLQRWRRPFEVAFWVVWFAVNGLFNSINARLDHPELPAWQPWAWEWSSAALMLALVPAVAVATGRWPLRSAGWQTSLPRHLAASVVFSLLHVGGMVALRKLAYLSQGQHYDFGIWPGLGYEYLKDVRSYIGIAAAIALYRLWLLRLQGDARLLAAPDDGLPAEAVGAVDRPERFLVRKLGKDFPLNAREIEWLQASGNYVNLHVRGRDYPLRATMAGIEQRLDPDRFVRVHRGYFVNLDYLAAIVPLDSGDARLQLHDGATIPCSRRYRTRLRERFASAAPAGTGHELAPRSQLTPL